MPSSEMPLSSADHTYYHYLIGTRAISKESAVCFQDSSSYLQPAVVVVCSRVTTRGEMGAGLPVARLVPKVNIK